MYAANRHITNAIIYYQTTSIMTNNNLSAVIPPVQSILCPDCSNHVTISPQLNSHGIAGINECLFHCQCRNIACQNCSTKKKVFLVCIACQSMTDRSVIGSMTRVTKSIKTTTKHAKSQQHRRSMKNWKKQSLIQEQQQSSVRDSPADNVDIDPPSSVKDSTNQSNPQPELPSHMLNSLSELKDQGFDSDSNPQHSTGPNISCQGVG